MFWRAPWLQARSALLGLAIWDATWLCLSYRYVSILRLGEWAGVNAGLVVALLTWTSSSYLIGRYSDEEIRTNRNIIHSAVLTAVPAILIATIFVGHAWLYQIKDAETRFRGFLLPLIICSYAAAIAGQAAVERITRNTGTWEILCSREEMEVISKEALALERSERPVFINGSGLRSKVVNGKKQARKVAVGEDMMEDEKTVEALLALRANGLSTLTTVRWCEQKLQRIPPELINAQWLVQAEGFALRPGSLVWRMKRAGDLFGATALLLVTSPILLVAAALIYAEDRGPVLYPQSRTGLYGQTIRIWKLRSMKTNAERDGAQWAKKDDPRITRVGRLMRVTRIDELPQLVSVIAGELSLIGPRPERPEIEVDLEKKIPHYRVRHWIRPGLSGWAQVCFPYGSSIEDSRQKLSYDLYYLRNAGILIDILITLKTIRLILRKEGSEPKTSGTGSNGEIAKSRFPYRRRKD